jgi:hypothetical protein
MRVPIYLDDLNLGSRYPIRSSDGYEGLIGYLGQSLTSAMPSRETSRALHVGRVRHAILRRLIRGLKWGKDDHIEPSVLSAPIRRVITGDWVKFSVSGRRKMTGEHAVIRN